MSMIEWAEKNAKINKYGAKEYSPFICHIMNMFDERARQNCECEWYSPYGFVIADGCELHD